MQKDPSAQRSAYLTALTQQIERKLQKALSSQSQRFDLLQQLFADIALEIDDRARDIILSRDEDEVTAADVGIENSLCFYDVLANHYVKVPENGKRILDLIVQLWSQSFASHIFALLFHKWLFEVPPENSEAVLRYGSALVQGATNVFWIDIQTNARRFLSLFCYLLEEVALVPGRLHKISLQTRRDLFSLLSRFIFFYNLDHLLENFLKQFPSPPNAFLVGGPADLFVIELTDQVLASIETSKVKSRASTSTLSFSYESPSRMGDEDDYKHQAESMPLQLHISWGSYVSNKSCSSCGLGYIRFAISCWASPSPCHKSLLPSALSMVLAFVMLEFHHHLHHSSILLDTAVNFFKLGEYD